MSDTGNGQKSTGSSQKVQDQPLTIREHLDPDKHWIGETLAPPTQGEIEATVGSVAGPGESPFVARADHKHKLGTGVVTPTNLASGIFNISARHGPGVTLGDDQAAYIGFGTGIQHGVYVLSSNTSSYGVMGWFRTGDTSGNATIWFASTSATTSAGAGTLGGATGTDGHLTIRARNLADFGRFYIENRTGATRGWTVTFLSFGGAPIPGDWIII